MEYIKNFIIYNSIGLFISGSFFTGLEYMSDRINFKKNMKSYIENMKFWAFDKVVSGYSLYKDVFERKGIIVKKDDINSLVYNYIGDINSSDTEDYLYIFEKRNINDSEYYVRTDITDIKPNNIFMSCELNNNGNIIDITQYISKFCISGMEIEKVFLKAFIKRFFNI